MKKLCLFFIICTLFVFAACSSSKKDVASDISDTTSEETDADNPDNGDTTDVTDSADTSDHADTSDSTDTTDVTDSGDSQNDGGDPTDDSGDSQNDGGDTADDSGDSQNDSGDTTDDSGDSSNDNDSTDDPGDSQDDSDSSAATNDDDADSGEPEPECTEISLDSSTLVLKPYYEGFYPGTITNGVLDDNTKEDLIEVDFVTDVADGSYTSEDYDCSSACVFLSQNYGTEEQALYFQESGTIVVSGYDPVTLEMSVKFSVKLVEVIRQSDGFAIKPQGKCLIIESGVVQATEPAENTNKTCADITTCEHSCSEDNSECIATCEEKGTAVARTQQNALEQCGKDHNCQGRYRCYYENCREEEAVCGMAVDPNYKVPYGHVTISGEFPYLHSDPKPVDPETGLETELPEEETKITLNSTYVIMGSFVTGTFGNNNTNVINQAAADKVYSFAQMSHFKAPNLTEKNITLVQTYQHEDGNNPEPTIHVVTTITQSREEPYDLGLGNWEEEARIFVKGTKSDGTQCDHAFGIGKLSISNISYPSISDVVTGQATQIAVSGSATLYSYKATPDYGGDITYEEHWVECDPVGTIEE